MTQYEFIEYIKQKRISKLMNQKTVAGQIPIGKSTYSKIENHIQNPNYFIIQRLAEIFDMDLNQIKSNSNNTMHFD